MSAKLIVFYNNESQLEFDRSKTPSVSQLAYLDKMDAKMQQGIEIQDDFFPDPDPLHRARFVAMEMIRAILHQDETAAAAACTYLAYRIPDLKAVKAFDSEGGGINIELAFDKDYANQVKVHFDLQ